MQLLADLFITGQDKIGLGINLLIVLLFFVAAWDVWAGRRKLRIERELIRTAQEALAAQDAEKPETLCPAASALAALNFLGIPEDTLLGHRVTRMMQLRLAGLGSRDVLQQLTTERVGAYGALARQIGISLTLLGLVGTVLGLSLALINIGDASIGLTGIEGLSRLSRALVGTLGGMKTAFGCTLAGLLTAVILSFMNYGLRRQQSVVSAEIEEFLICELLPAIEKVDPDADSASKVFAGVLARVSAQMEAVSQNMLLAADSYNTSTNDVKATLFTLTESVDKFAGVMNQVAGNQTEFSKTMAETREAVTGVRVAVAQSSQLLGEQVAALRGETKSNEAIQKSIIAYHEEYKKFTAEATEILRRAIESAVKVQAAETRHIVDDVLSKHFKGLEGLVTDHKGVMQTVSDMVLDVQLNGRARSAAAQGGHS